ncbi:MAG: penicillin-binding protein 2 [Dehalococcoidia bacterium]|nr:penicillin-binding protein 2 [Dehalococcoidia bacterium]
MTPVTSEGRRLLMLLLVAVVGFSILGVQLVRFQFLGLARVPTFVSGEAPRVLETEAPRGLIVDRDGTVIAHNVPEFAIVVIPDDLPADLEERRRALVDLERRIDVPYGELEQLVRNGLRAPDQRAPVAVKRGLEREEAIALRASLADIPGVEVRASAQRVYGGGELLGRILGHIGAISTQEVEGYLAAGYPLDARVGQSGLEHVYEEALRGDPERRLVLADPTGREVSELATAAARPGADLVLSLDLDLQTAVTEALKRGIQAGLPARREAGREPPVEAGAAVVLDVRTGEVLSLVSLPSFDANLFAGTPDTEAIERILNDPARPLIDRTYMEVKAPGSIFKPLVALAALEEGVVVPGTLITSTGALHVRDMYNPSVVYTFRDWAAHGTLDLYGGIARSSDVYFYYLGGGYYENGREVFEGLGPERLSEWARAAGLGRPTGIDLPGETDGLVPTPEWKEETYGEPWVLGDSYTYSIGQGYLTVTPLQMAVVTAAIANGGDLLVPHVVRGIREGQQLDLLPRTTSGQLPGSEAHFEVVREAMRMAAMPSGTANTGQPADVTIGGKTGTAEFGVRYSNGEYPTHGWFSGFGPYEDPEIAVIVYLEHGVGQTNAGPVAKEIFEAYFALQAETAAEGEEAGASAPGGGR